MRATDWTTLIPVIDRVGRVRCEPGWRLDWPAHHLMDYDLWFVWAGRGTMETPGGVVPLRPGVCLLLRPGSGYFGQQDPADRLGVTFIHFTLPCLPAELPEVAEVADFTLFDAAARRIVQLRNEPPTPSSLAGAEATALLRSLLLCLASSGAQGTREAASPARAEHMRKIRALTTRIRESPGTLPEVREIAREAGYSPAHFARVFREITGVLPQEFIIQCRIERARQLLYESALGVGEIAAALGYADIYFFSRQFKDRTGVSPSGYREQRTSKGPAIP